ncbi:hypothetical protein ZIOFF_049100 [Zingiber officinale]|uniref:Uncharacterized protein n=1 Tax=Zingiber officinale TaxID=94328 RepID=A0A8J5FS58_ZINOF|nr:hypothetical protein ZIOFF_049100 [Zingiber officinale]
MNSQDWALVRKVKAMIKELLDLTIPPAQCYMLIETDGCKDNLLADALSRLLCVLTGPWTHTEKDLLMLTQMEETLKQLDSKPNTTASRHLAGLIISWCNTKNWPNPAKPGSSIQRNMTKEPHMEDIEWTTSRNVINSIRELELICRVKENDFKARSTQKRGLYFKDALPAVTNTRIELLEAFLKMQSTLQHIKDTPP